MVSLTKRCGPSEVFAPAPAPRLQYRGPRIPAAAFQERAELPGPLFPRPSRQIAAPSVGLCRRRGLHFALLRRLKDAIGAGVDLACGGADFVSTSHRKMERMGMRLLFVRAAWTPIATLARNR